MSVFSSNLLTFTDRPGFYVSEVSLSVVRREDPGFTATSGWWVMELLITGVCCLTYGGQG